MMKRLFITPLLSLCATSLLFADYYIADTGGGVSGNGTQGNPTNCGVGGSDIVTVMSSIPINTVIHIGAGNYYPSNDIIVKSGWSVIGAGMGQTIFHIGGVSPTKGGHGENYVFRGADDFAENIYISDFTADCTTTVQNCETGSVVIQGKTVIIERVETINPKATIAYGNEGSPFCIFNNSTVGWGRIAGCKVTIAPVSDPNPAYPGSGQPQFLDNYLAALSIFGQTPGDMSGEVENNTVTCTGTPSPGAVGTVTAYGTGHAHDMVLRNNSTFHVDVGVTMDTYSKTNISIIGNYFMDCVLLGMNIGGGVCDGFLIRDNVITTRKDGFIFTGNTSNFTVSDNFVSGVAGYTPSSGLVVNTMYGPNSHYIFSGNQIAPNLTVSIPSGVTDYALDNQTGTSGGGIPGNYTSPGLLNVQQPANAPVSIDSGSLTVSGSSVGKLTAKSTGLTDAQMWLTSQDKSMIWAKVNSDNGDQMRLYFHDGTNLSQLAFFTPDGYFLSNNLRLGYAAPNSIVTAPPGTFWANQGGGAGTTGYLKESGTGNTGWKAILTESNRLTNTVTTTTTPTVNVYNSLDFATVTVTGATVGDTVMVGLPNPPPAQFVFDAYVSAADTVKIRASNVAGANRTLPTGTYRVTVLK